jgi:hypothetical protein
VTPRKSNPSQPNPVLTLRIPGEMMRQLDEICTTYSMNRNQLLLMLIAKEYAKLEKAP